MKLCALATGVTEIFNVRFHSWPKDDILAETEVSLSSKVGYMSFLQDDCSTVGGNDDLIALVDDTILGG